VLDKFIRKFPRVARWFAAGRLSRIPRPMADLTHIRVIRHRVRLGLGGNGQRFAAGAAAALVVIAALLANVAEQRSGEADGAYEDVAGALAERQSASERADRADRPAAGPSEPGEAKAAEPEKSPEPEPKQKKKKKKQKPKPDWVHPMPEATTTSCYGMRWGRLHAGVDLAAPHGTKIRAVGAGTVVNAGWAFSGYGISVVIDHGNGFLTHYAHASKTRVSVGEKVKPGDVIALEGSTGDSTGPHLHFEVHDGMWNQVEPTSWLRDRDVSIGGC